MRHKKKGIITNKTERNRDQHHRQQQQQQHEKGYAKVDTLLTTEFTGLRSFTFSLPWFPHVNVAQKLTEVHARLGGVLEQLPETSSKLAFNVFPHGKETIFSMLTSVCSPEFCGQSARTLCKLKPRLKGSGQWLEFNTRIHCIPVIARVSFQTNVLIVLTPQIFSPVVNLLSGKRA
jgi:hypothetical protein